MDPQTKNTLFIVVPCYNEEEALPLTNSTLLQKLKTLIKDGKVSGDSKIMYVDDGSKDGTWQLIESLNTADPLITGIKLSRNRGHQNALLAGLMTAKEKADCVISMDADLQDDVNAVDKFIEEFNNGADIVYGVRKSRDKDTAFKRGSANSFYKLMKLMGVDIIDNHADYRLMSKRALNSLSEFDEVNLFLRGIVPQIGYKTSQVMYDRAERVAGESKYPLKKMLSFAFDGITSFSIKPIRAITVTGCVFAFISFIFTIFALISGNFNPVLESVWLLGGLQLAAIGVVGEYVGKAYMEVKHRPKYIIEKILE